MVQLRLRNCPNVLTQSSEAVSHLLKTVLHKLTSDCLRASERAFVWIGFKKATGDFEGLHSVLPLLVTNFEWRRQLSDHAYRDCAHPYQMQQVVSDLVCRHAGMRHFSSCSCRKILIRSMFPSFFNHNFFFLAPNSPRRFHHIDHDGFRGVLPRIGNVKKIRYHDIESDMIPFCGYIIIDHLTQARRAKELFYLPAAVQYWRHQSL